MRSSIEGPELRNSVAILMTRPRWAYTSVPSAFLSPCFCHRCDSACSSSGVSVALEVVVFVIAMALSCSGERRCSRRARLDDTRGVVLEGPQVRVDTGGGGRHRRVPTERRFRDPFRHTGLFPK